MNKEDMINTWKKVKVLVAQSCPALCNPMDCSLAGSSVHGILQARILEWVAFISPGDLPYPGIQPWSLTLQADSLSSEPPGKESRNCLKCRRPRSDHCVRKMPQRREWLPSLVFLPGELLKWYYLLSYKREWNLAMCNNMGRPGGYCVKWNKSEKDKYCLFSLICGI